MEILKSSLIQSIIMLSIFCVTLLLPGFVYSKIIDESTDMVASTYFSKILNDENATDIIKENAINMYSRMSKNQQLEAMDYKAVITILGAIIGLGLIITGVTTIRFTKNTDLGVCLVIIGIVIVCSYLAFYKLNYLNLPSYYIK